MNKSILITICARGGSKGIPQKNIKLLNEKPLISYSIKHANNIKQWFEKDNNYEVDVELSTDSKAIIKVAEEYGLKTIYLRPDYLADDTAGKLDAIKDLLLFSENNRRQYDFILDLDVSAPMRTIQDLKEGFNLINSINEADNLFSVSRATKNPYFNMVEKEETGFYSLSKNIGQVLSRQKAPEVFEMNASFYFYRRNFFNKKKLRMFNNSLIFEMKHHSFDLDNIIEFEFLEFLIATNKLNFEI